MHKQNPSRVPFRLLKIRNKADFRRVELSWLIRLHKANLLFFPLLRHYEAHCTAGTKESSLFSLALENYYIPAKKRLFMTATQRLIKPFIIKRAEELNLVIFSMDDEGIYGPILQQFNFGDAIKEKVISDYKIIIAGIEEKELYDWIKKNKDLISEDLQRETKAFTLFTQVLVAKCFKEYPIRKVISFHSTIRNAKVFIGECGETFALGDVINRIDGAKDISQIFISHVNGSMPTGHRKEIMDIFKYAEYGVVSNARCLTVGVDVPTIDCVYFVDEKKSLVDIVQACGRALRKPRDSYKELAFFVIPILVPDDIEMDEIVNLDAFETLFNIIQALREQDQRMEEWINQININAIKGKGKYSRSDFSPISITLPHKIDLEKFEEKLYLKIAEVNANPRQYKASKSYGKKERKSGFKRIFKTIGDYSVASYQKELVDPTMQRFKHEDYCATRQDLFLNHNNISHTYRLGLVTKKGKIYELTPLGKKYLRKGIKFNDLFKRQLLRYSNVLEESEATRILFPYRTCLKILLQTKILDFVDFAFTVYTIYDSSDDSLRQAIGDILYLRDKYPNISLVNKANQPKVLEQLNAKFKTNFSETDIWAKKTTIYNQYIYFRNHLALFEEFITVDSKRIQLTSLTKAHNVLAKDNKLEFEKSINKILETYTKPFMDIILFTL